MKFIFSTLIVLFICQNVSAQKLTLKGTIRDSKDNSVLISAAVSLAPAGDTNSLTGTFTDANGVFEFDNLNKGTYQIRVSYLGYESMVRYLKMDSGNKNIGTLKLKPESEMLKTVTIEA